MQESVCQGLGGGGNMLIKEDELRYKVNKTGGSNV